MNLKNALHELSVAQFLLRRQVARLEEVELALDAIKRATEMLEELRDQMLIERWTRSAAETDIRIMKAGEGHKT